MRQTQLLELLHQAKNLGLQHNTEVRAHHNGRDITIQTSKLNQHILANRLCEYLLLTPAYPEIANSAASSKPNDNKAQLVQAKKLISRVRAATPPQPRRVGGGQGSTPSTPQRLHFG